MEARILVVDDEKEIADLVELFLTNEGFQVYKYYTGAEAMECVQTTSLDLAILDVMLPDLDGFTLCQRIRESYTYPIIMLTAREHEMDKITGLTLGADDYVTKPFRPLELIARVKAQLRRYKRYSSPGTEDDVITVSGLVLDREKHGCWLNEKPISLTPIEFSILWYLCKNKGKVVSSEELFRVVWKEKYFTSSNNTVMVHIRHIREKMKDSAENPKYIKNVWGVGYKVEE
ncbi:VanR-ABDEGLN family response regulator transcription factor [Lactonifactor longoviformis]|uniref:VanR-ABDEGLN family response regulator transcription factor n=1 Tax=Lactonifactor longoviformis TaxID=341220 RepID=UPI00210D3242|nr:VanR-ABDEGLN family response regulator transcription factor [Lactonifactor longoviformis]